MGFGTFGLVAYAWQQVAGNAGPARRDRSRNTITGEWKRDGQALITPSETNDQARNRLYLPVTGKLPEEYDLELKLARVGETPKGWEALNVGLVSGDVQATFYLYGGSQRLELGLANIDGEPASENGTRHASAIGR